MEESHETWNVSLWIGNDEGLYNIARSLRNRADPYGDFVADMHELGMPKTPDGVAWDDLQVDTDAMNEFMEDL